MSAVYVSNLTINSGADFSNSFELGNSDTNQNLDLTDYSAYAQMRKYSGSASYIEFSVSIPSPKTLGKIVISLSSNQTTNIKPGRYIYDVVIERFGTRTRVVEGMILVREGATKL